MLDATYCALGDSDRLEKELPAEAIMGNAPKAIRPQNSEAYHTRGESGVYLVSDGKSPTPYRVRYWSASCCYLRALRQEIKLTRRGMTPPRSGN